MNVVCTDCIALRAKLHAAQRELRRLQGLAADATLDMRAAADDANGDPRRWDQDPDIEWAGIAGGDR